MTVHAAKGLEFLVVFLAALQKGIDAKPGAISFSPRVGLGARWHHPLGRADRDDAKDDAFQHAIRRERKQSEKEESQRLLYVAMTRAEEHLVLSFSTNGKKPQNWAAVVSDCLPVQTVAEPPQRPAARESAVAAESPQALPRPHLTDQYDSQANITSIAMFADCPRRYYLSRYLGFEAMPRAADAIDTSSGLSASEFGRQVHALLAGSAVESPDPEANRLANQFRRSALGRRAAAAASIEREFDFLMEVEGLVLRGQIDLWFEDRSGSALVDYKTDRVSAAEAPLRAEQYAVQLRLYALALERLNGRAPDEAYICFLRPNLAVPVDLRPSLFESPEAAVSAFREAQERQHFPLREGAHCVTCPHFSRLCPARPVPGAAVSPSPA